MQNLTKNQRVFVEKKTLYNAFVKFPRKIARKILNSFLLVKLNVKYFFLFKINVITLIKQDFMGKMFKIVDK